MSGEVRSQAGSAEPSGLRDGFLGMRSPASTRRSRPAPLMSPMPSHSMVGLPPELCPGCLPYIGGDGASADAEALGPLCCQARISTDTWHVRCRKDNGKACDARVAPIVRDLCVETYGNGVRHAEVLDPDGNSLSLAQAPIQ